MEHPNAGPRLRIVGEIPVAYAERIAAAWQPGLVTDGPGTAILAWDYAVETLVGMLTADAGVQWVHTRAVGVDPRLLRLVAARGVLLSNGSGAHGAAIAEYVVAALLAHYKRIPELLAAARDRTWREPFPMAELGSKTVAVIGLGDLGRSTARLLCAFGARVLGVRREGGPVAGVDEVVPAERLRDVLPRADAVVLATPLTERTRGMIGAAELALLPPHAYLVNVGRGPVVDEAALVAALRSGSLAGAALDVFDDEPLPPASPLWQVPNLLVSPHCSDATAETDGRALDGFLRNVERFRTGQPLAGLVEPGRGY
jgi:phosphoglycerate dehydrogenase-like enzyme